MPAPLCCACAAQLACLLSTLACPSSRSRYSSPPSCYDAAYAAVKQAFVSAFFGPPKGGVYSPSVQYTLFRMGQEALARCVSGVGCVQGPCVHGLLSSRADPRPAPLAPGPPPACSVPEVDSVFLNMPNLHFIPCAPVTSRFDDDVYVATSEPHGNIEAVVTRPKAQPHCRL